MNTKLTESAKSVGQVEELKRAVESQRTEVTIRDNQLLAARGENNRLTSELATAQAEANSARTSLTQQIATEKAASAQALIREKEACTGLIQSEKDRCADLIKKEKESSTDEKAASARALVREKEACAGLIQSEKERCAELIKKEKESCVEVLAAKDKELEAKDAQITNLKEFIETASETLGTHFKAISQDTLKDVSAQFEKAAKQVIEQNSVTTEQNVKLHKEQIEKLLQPVGVTLDQLDKQIKDTDTKRTKAESEIHTVIRESADTNRQLSEALRKPVMRGTYGEVKLQTLLESCGLTEGEDYELQAPVFGEDEQGRVDALVNMAQGKKLVIDSKNLLEPFVEYANAETPEESARLLKEFQKKCRETLRALSLKQYAEKVNTIDAVLMFLPDEGMYYAALEADRQLIAKMTEQRVYVVSPTSLLPILKSVAYILGLERQNKNTQAVVDAGRILYGGLRELMEELRVLGTNLDRSTKNYNEVIKRFETQLVPRSRKLQKMRVNRGKSLPELTEIPTEIRHLAAPTVTELQAIPIALPSVLDELEEDSVFDDTAEESNLEL